MSPRVRVDRDRCIGAGNCVLTLPAVFDQDDDEGLVVVLDPEPPPAAADLLTRAVQLCPSGAISTVTVPSRTPDGADEDGG